MKNYFAKYLPKPGGFRRTVKDANGIPYSYEEEVQLFLCSENKIIGLISPEAKWVKEYDQFDEEEWDWKAYDEDTMHDKTIPPRNKELQIINVKGPCGHFH